MLSLVHTANVVDVELEPDRASYAFDTTHGTGLFFDAACGLLVISYAKSLYHIQLDGKATRWSGLPGGSAQPWGGTGYHATRDRTALSTLYGRIDVVELPSTHHLEPTTAEWLGTQSFVMLPDRNLRYSAGRVWCGAPDQQMNVIEKVLRATPPNGSDIICPAMPAPCYRWWCMSAGDGLCLLYNSTTNLIEKTVRIGAFTNAGYSVKNDLFVVRTAANELRVYANDPEPAVLSAPVFDLAPRLGGISELSAQLHGADGEPCVGYVVQFVVTSGTLDRDAAITDATGKAKVQYRGPANAAQNATATATFDEA